MTKWGQFVIHKCNKMKNTSFFLLLLFIGSFSFSQSNQKRNNSGDSNEQLSIVNINEKYGLVDNKGTEVLPPKYEEIHPFGVYQEHWAMIIVNGKSGFVDHKGRVILPPKYYEIHPFGVYQEHWAMIIVNGKSGFIDNNGLVVVPPKYDEITSAETGVINGVERKIR